MQESHDHYFEEDSIYQAISKFEDMLKSNGACYFDVFEFEVIIDYYLDQLDHSRAEDAINLAINQHPSSSDIKYRLAQLYIQSGKPAKGLRLLRNIENLETTNSDFYLLKGTALNLLGKKEEATQSFDYAIQYAEFSKDDVIYNIAYSYINTRRYNLAIKYLNLAYEINPDNLSVILELAIVYERVDKLDESADYYIKYLDIEPFNDSVWVNLGMVYSSMEKLERALDSYEYAIAIQADNTTALFSKANTLVNLDKYKEAIVTYQEILDYESNNVQAYVYIGECYEKLASYKRSLYYFKRAIDIDEMFSDAWYGIGISNYQQENYSESLIFFKKANKLDPENSDYWFMLGEVYRKLNIIEKSAESYNRVVELDPNDSEAWISRAELSYKDNDDLKGAIRILNKALEMNPEISDINYQLAAYYFYNNQSKLAFRHFEKGLSINYTNHSGYLKELPLKHAKQLDSLLNKYTKQ